MNVLGQPQQNQQQQQNAQNQPQQTSGGQSASIASGQPQQASQAKPQAQKAPKAKSGMFTNIRKYMERNKPGAQQMGQKMQQNISQQNQNIQQAIGKQKTDFMSRVEQNRARMEKARGFGQEAIGRAQGQVDKDQLASQQQQLQQRIGSFGENKDQYVQQYQDYVQGFQPPQQPTQGQEQQPQQPIQGQEQQPQQPMSFEDYTKQQLDYSGVKKATQEGGYLQAQQELLSSLANERISDTEANRDRYYSPTIYYSKDQMSKMAKTGLSDRFLNEASDTLQRQIRGLEYQASYVGISPQQQAQMDSLKEKMSQINTYRKNKAETLKAVEAQKRLEGIQTQLSESKEAQRLFENKRGLETELAALEDKIANAPEQLTDEEIQRFNNLRTGVERFDDAILNLSQQQAQTEDLAKQARGLETAQGRRDLMRKQFGAKGGYTSGQAALDNLILTGDKQGMRDLIQNTKEQAKQSENMLKEAFQQGRITQDEMRRGSDNIRKELQASVDEAQTKLLEGSKEYRDMTKNLTDLESRLASDVLTPEERTELQTQADSLREQVSSFEGDIGLTGRARTGEGTMLKQIQDKLKSGQGLSAEEMNILGIDPNNPYATISDDMLRNVQIDPETFSIQDVATSQDVARASALARLAGGQADTYLQSKLGLEQDQLERIKKRGLMVGDDKFGTTFEELSQADREALSGARGQVAQHQAKVKAYSNEIDSAKRLANKALAERSKEGGGTPHWKYWNHYYVTALQKAARARKGLTNMMKESNIVRSENISDQDAFKKRR
jgi:polyhydroxyalkanoate synthesis regulator phasin